MNFKQLNITFRKQTYKSNVVSYLLILFFLIIGCAKISGQDIEKKLRTTTQFTSASFPLIHNKKVPPILTDKNDAEVVEIASKAFANDLELVSGSKPAVIHDYKKKEDYLIIAGTIGHSAFIDQLIKSKKIDVSAIQNKWESYSVSIINAPIKGVKQALVITGSDRRGTAYGLFEISKLAGVSPLVYWADVKPKSLKSLYILPGTFIQKEPSVKYRGIFINDEDWGLNPWAAKKQDTDIRDIGPKTYAKVFELLLRLKANLIWPAMHDSTKAFWYYPQNPVIADKYAIVIGSTHCDMMLRSNTFEWQIGYEKEYGHKPGIYRYDTNKDEVLKYWDDRVNGAKNYEAMYTVGMRGIRDGGITGPETKEGKIALVENVIGDQRSIFKKYFGAPTNALQIFCPYKEVLDLYTGGLKVPDDVTLVWTDDNFGYLRQLSNTAEQKRSGASGIYYHLSYLGGPHDYTWLSSNSPSLIAYEMTKAYQFGADRFWVVNVGDIKPAEMETQFFLDLAWDTKKWTPENASNYVRDWAEETFGTPFADEIAVIKNQYYQLAQSGKPEHMGLLQFDSKAKGKRLEDYSDLVEKVDQLKERIPQSLKNAYFELIEYPSKGAALMTQKFFYAQMSLEVFETNKELALDYSQKAKNALEQIIALTQYYNKGIENGKWDGIMTHAPRNLETYAMPKISNPEILSDSIRNPATFDKRYLEKKITFIDAPKSSNLISLNASDYKNKQEIFSEKIITVDGLGLDGKSISRYPFTGKSFANQEYTQAPYVDFIVNLKTGEYQLSLKSLPCDAINKERNLNLAVVVNQQAPQFIDTDNSRKDKNWTMSVVRGYFEKNISFKVDEEGETKIRIYLQDTGLALSRIDIDLAGN
ncbi:glycosyl hydrolase 115 family protein [Flavobacterium pectinovorum]|uniref:glycosyl hydrolase 115 family protein n=1 Tax=Flavobacterium pectinovorum TaxID=29533 RepID=UPI001FADCF28|nr:glycosyl hydrolase 115 family protein [Flavobacterium pectinovorum]MCI9846000.1 glycosyl hydrolase 115 family protein [Flavobacterium pectinovorum]